ncbi:MAG TPA: serine--tRNA ligase, partial [bacterium]|nr:serine--tRNA ligase [bacterium]
PEKVKEGIRKKGVEVDLDEILRLDEKRRKLQKRIDEIRAQKNKASREIVRLKEAEREKLLKELKELDKEGDILEKEFKEIEKKFWDLMAKVPNLPFDEVPVGKDERDNVVLKEVGEIPKFDFEPKDHLEIGEALDIIDVKRAAKTSGTRFGFLKGKAVLLEFALVNFALETLMKEGFVPVIPPVLIKEKPFWGMGYLDRGAEEVYFIEKDNLYLIGTAEQILGPMHMDEIFKEDELPKRYVGFSSCFRREAGSYGKDTRGIFRVHQFDKVEMFSFCKPEDSKKEHLFFLEMEERLMKALKIPYRVINICTGDLGDPAAAKFDIEAWLPGQGRYRETHSTSNCTDYQARRLNIRYRAKDGKLHFVHTINGTAFAIGRTIIAILENYQQKDGSVKVPEILQKYLPFKEIR